MKQEPEDEDDGLSEEGKSPERNAARRRSHARSLRAMANPSAVWGHFDLCVNDPLRAQCRLCGSVVVRGGANPRQCGTTNLHRHLRVHHGGRLIGRRYHVMPGNVQPPPPPAKPLKIGHPSAVRSQLRNIAPGPPPSQQNQPKTLVLKTIPLKVKQVAPTTIKMPSRQRPPQQPIRLAPKVPPPQQPTEVCLRWNSYHSNMQNSFPSLLDSEEFVDVTLACEGKSVKCHKIILSSCSDYLASLLRENPCQHPIILMKDLKFWEVEALVKFMYKGEVNVAHDKLPQLLNAAEALQVKGLAGPTPSQNQKPPMLIPQPKPTTLLKPLQRLNQKSTETKEHQKNLPTAAPSSQSSPKRGTKRSLEAKEPKPFTKIRLQRPKSPTSRAPSPVIKLEPLDIPLSPADIFPENNDGNSSPNYDNLMTMHEADDPGGDDLQFGAEDINEAEEFVPTDFLEQEQDIEEADGECSRSSILEITDDNHLPKAPDEDDPGERRSNKKDKT